MAEPETPDASLLASLYLLEAFVVLAAIGALRHGALPGLWHLGTPHGQRFVVGFTGALAAGMFVANRYRRARPNATKRFWMTAGLNALTVSLLLITGEVSIRALSRNEPQGTVSMGTLLLPRDWRAVAGRNRELLAKRPSNISYFVRDDLLGWTIGPNRRSSDGLYASSAEGIRSASPDVAFAKHEVPHRVALVGDSYTFGLDVPFERSWGRLLERELAPDVQVLNFGVDGYGVDQSYLRYHRDVRPWHPELVVFGFINHDFYRNLTVYSFVDFPEWGFPFSKPRFVAGPTGALTLLNVPPIPAEEIAAKQAVTELPFLAYDRGFRPEDWQRRWYHHSYVLRYVLSRFHSDPVLSPDVSDEARESLSTEILATFVDESTREGAKAILVFFPSRADLRPRGPEMPAHERVKSAVFSALRRKGITVFDLTSCLAATDRRTLFLDGRPHYSPQGNAAVAKCLLPIVAGQLGEQNQNRNATSR